MPCSWGNTTTDDPSHSERRQRNCTDCDVVSRKEWRNSEIVWEGTTKKCGWKTALGQRECHFHVRLSTIGWMSVTHSYWKFIGQFGFPSKRLPFRLCRSICAFPLLPPWVFVDDSLLARGYSRTIGEKNSELRTTAASCKNKQASSTEPACCQAICWEER